MSLRNILQIRDLFIQGLEDKSLTLSVANYMVNQITYNLGSVIKSGLPSEMEEVLCAIDEIYEVYHKLER